MATTSSSNPRGAMRGKPRLYRARLRRQIDGAGVSYTGELWGARTRVWRNPDRPDEIEIEVEIKSALSAGRVRRKPRHRDRRAILDFTSEQDEALALTP